MSGPKVIRIVTREEVEANCRAQLRALDTILAQLQRCAKQHDAWNSDYAAKLESRRKGLDRLLESHRWSDVQKQVPIEISFLREEMERITTEAIAAAEAHRRRGRRLADAAASVVVALEAGGQQVPTSLRQAARRASAATLDEIPAIEAELNHSISLLSAASPISEPTDRQRELASRLGRGEKTQSLADWVARQPPSESGSDPRLGRLIATMEVLDRKMAAPFITRAEELERERSADRRALLTDSLILDLRARLTERQTWHSMLDALEEARATLESVGLSEAGKLLEQLEAAVEAENTEQASVVIAATRDLAASEARREAAQARRRAVLRGLAALGYEVRESMETAWAQSGRIVVKKPGVTDYGVELGAVADAERMQVQLVGAADPAEPRNAARDRDAEVQWCSELQELRGTMASGGSELVVERAVVPGAQAVKTMTFEQAELRAAVESTRHKGRRLS
jgi:hypothetical protein